MYCMLSRKKEGSRKWIILVDDITECRFQVKLFESSDDDIEEFVRLSQRYMNLDYYACKRSSSDMLLHAEIVIAITYTLLQNKRERCSGRPPPPPPTVYLRTMT